MKTLLSLLALSTLISGCAKPKPNPQIDPLFEQQILRTVIEAHNTLATCIVESKEFKLVKVCVEDKYKESQKAKAPTPKKFEMPKK